MALVYRIDMGETVEEVTTLKEVASILGVSRVSGKDIENGKYPEVTAHDDGAGIESLEELNEVLEEVGIDPNEEVEEDDFLDEHITVIPVGEPPTKPLERVENTTSDDKVLTNKEKEPKEDTKEVPTDSIEDEADLEYPEVGDFKDEKAIKKYIKKLSDEQLEEWCELEGATWKHNDHKAINRMRMAMAIKAVHFPELNKPKATKKKSKYAKYSTEELVQMALDNDVVVRDAKGDERIERMYTIMALRDAGLLA